MEKKKLPFLYGKLMQMLEGSSDFGKTNSGLATETLTRKFRLTKQDVKECMRELDDYGQLQIKRKLNAPSVIYVGNRMRPKSN